MPSLGFCGRQKGEKMRKYDTVLFDLDGTLTDPESGLVSSFKYALDKMGLEYGDRDSLKRFIGPPLYAEWKSLYSLSEADADKALMLFHEYYSVYGWWDNELYGGIKEMLSALKGAGMTLAVATSKPEFFAKKVISLYGLCEFFDFIGAADGDRARDKKHEVIDYVFGNIGEERRKRAVLVGDRKYDAAGAALCGIDSVGVLWGHGSEEEIDGAGFTHKASTPCEVIKIFGI